MKIIAINSSPKGKASNTLKLVNAALDGARGAGAETEVIDACKLKISFCKGDSSCYKTGKCFQKDDYEAFKKKVTDADGIIFSAPNYIDNIPAQLKVLFDRSANFIHEQSLDGKYGFVIATSGSANFGTTVRAMNDFLMKSGGRSTGKLAVAMAEGPEAFAAAEVKAHKMGRGLVKAIEEKRKYPAQAAAHKKWKDSFRNTMKRNKEQWKHNYEYWVSKGWLKA
jgi:multimeric flavodoxin WrbA